MSSIAMATTPGRPFSLRGFGRVLEHLFHRTPAKYWSAIVAGLISPAFFLGLLGLGLGSLVDERQADSTVTTLGTASYLEFIGPGLLAISAVLWAFGQSLWPTASEIQWDKTYVLTAATPVTKTEIAVAHIAWITLRFLAAALLFTGVLAVAGAVTSWWAALAPLAGGLTVASIAGPTCAYTVRQDDANAFPMILRLGAIPMFLFSGAFFPLSEMPATVAWLARLTPAWHGVELCRDLAAGQLSAATLVYVGYLVSVTVVGLMATVASFEKMLSEL